MSLQNKFPGGGRSGDTRPASSGSRRTYREVTPTPSNSSVSNNRTMRGVPSSPQDSHQSDIGQFQSGISSHHPFKERGGAFSGNRSAHSKSPAERSRFVTPSSSTSDRSGGRSRSTTRQPDRYNDPKVENSVPVDAARRKPSGPAGGVRGIMNGYGRGKK